ncbi:MAG: fatty acid--CoA ligase family protein [Acidimicrobiia bacterium]|nr:fatty acid--CoA ligase family protein [Acidimicrobiia bacterium]
MGDLIALAVPAGPQLIDLITESWDRGDAFAPLDPKMAPRQRTEQLAVIAPTVVLHLDEDGRLHRDSHDGHPVADGDALVLTTSGTDGRPKAVVHTHDSISASAQATSNALSVDPLVDKWLACLPVTHIGGLSVILRSLVTGTPVDVHDGFDPERVRRAATVGGATLVSLVTRALNQVPAELFRTILIGGAAAPADLPGNVIPTYGMTETGSGVVYGKHILDGCEIQIIDDDHNPVDGPGISGRIALRGPMLFRGYRSADGVVSNPFVDGAWFPTDDLGHWNDDGSLAVEGRRGDVIVTGGRKVWPTPIEQLLAARPDIAEVAVVGRPDPDWGHRVVAVVVPSDPGTPPTVESLKDTVLEHLPPWWAPKELVVRTTPLPRTSLGKLRRPVVLPD